MKERRRFTDVVEEEQERRRDSRLDAWSREDFSVYKPIRILKEGETCEETVTEVKDGYRTDGAVLGRLSAHANMYLTFATDDDGDLVYKL